MEGLACEHFALRFYCIENIAENLWSLYGAGQIVGTAYPDSGFQVASKLLGHYLMASGSELYLSASELGSQIQEEVKNRVRTAAKNALFTNDELLMLLINPCVEGASAPLDMPDPLITQNAYPITKPGWYSLAETLGIADDLPESFARNGGYLDGYYIAFGAGVFMEVVGESSFLKWSDSRLLVNTIVEVSDRFDWCPGFGACTPSSEHFLNFRTGHFFALEAEGFAKQFNWYSYLFVQTVIDFQTFQPLSTSLTTLGWRPKEHVHKYEEGVIVKDGSWDSSWDWHTFGILN